MNQTTHLGGVIQTCGPEYVVFQKHLHFSLICVFGAVQIGRKISLWRNVIGSIPLSAVITVELKCRVTRRYRILMYWTCCLKLTPGIASLFLVKPASPHEVCQQIISDLPGQQKKPDLTHVTFFLFVSPVCGSVKKTNRLVNKQWKPT